MTVVFVLVAMLYFHTGVLVESQELARTKRNPAPSPAFQLFLQKLQNSNMKLLGPQVKSVPQSRITSASDLATDFLDSKSENSDGSINDSTVPKDRVKRGPDNKYKPSRCFLGICNTLNLAYRLYQLGPKGKEPSPPKSTDDPNGYGKRRRRSLISLLGWYRKLQMHRLARKK
ncbi:pro-adrenomedullin-like [Hemiscyllium ocellatum]|uniref:pro-adrenomedullin-like n=1 Tax=Hemiscyllium ocellatum TaxID=170820 RepID=UPI0029664CB5|nr:pro-adrenomedullin-like [Hemiscyllium ocellatum]